VFRVSDIAVRSQHSYWTACLTGLGRWIRQLGWSFLREMVPALGPAKPVFALVGYLENGVLSSQRAGFWINGPRCFRSRSGPKLPILSMYSDPPSRIDGRVLEPAHQSIPDLQIEADAMKTRAVDLGGQQRFARSSRNPPRESTGAHHSSRQLPGQGPPAS
jgi:hypothetical protein